MCVKVMNTWVCARAEVNAGVIISTASTLYPNTSINNINNMQNREERKEFIDLSGSFPLKKKQTKTLRLYYEKAELKHWCYQ